MTKEKVSAKQILNSDGTSSAYQVTVTGFSPQAFMSVDASYYIKRLCEDTDEVRNYLDRSFRKAFRTFFPDGIRILIGEAEGELKIADYYDDFSDTDAQIYQRIYASPESTWIVPAPDDPIFVIYDSEGNAHLADPIFLDKAGRSANIPFILCDPQEEATSNRYINMYMLVVRKDSGWKILGITRLNAGYANRTNLPMNDAIFLLRHVLNPAAYPLAAVPAPAEAEVWAEFAAVLRRYSRIHR